MTQLRITNYELRIVSFDIRHSTFVIRSIPKPEIQSSKYLFEWG